MKRHEILAPALALLVAAGACDQATGPEGSGSDDAASGPVQVRFATTLASGQASVLETASQTAGSVGDTLRIDGSNGTLIVTDIRMVVDELELEGEGCPGEGEMEDEGGDDRESSVQSTEEDGGGHDDCEVESEAFFLDLPLDEGVVTVADDSLPEGMYDRVKFEVDDAGLDEDEAEEAGILAQEIRAEFPEWPDNASLMVEGLFLPAGGGDAQPFRAFFDAEIEVEMSLNPPVLVTADGADRVLTVEVRPERWFQRSDGTVVDLSTLDFETTGRVAELEVELEHGFAEVEHHEEREDDD